MGPIPKMGDILCICKYSKIQTLQYQRFQDKGYSPCNIKTKLFLKSPADFNLFLLVQECEIAAFRCKGSWTMYFIAGHIAVFRMSQHSSSTCNSKWLSYRLHLPPFNCSSAVPSIKATTAPKTVLSLTPSPQISHRRLQVFPNTSHIPSFPWTLASLLHDLLPLSLNLCSQPDSSF